MLLKNKMEVIVLDGSPIAIKNINFSLTDLEKKEINNLKYYNNKNSALTSKNIFLFKNKLFKRIEKIIEDTVDEYKKNVLGIKDELKCIHSWSTLNEKSEHKLHQHKNSFISCCFYVENEGDNKLFFNISNSTIEKCFNFHFKIEKYNFFNSSSWSINIKKGMIVIFLSNLFHSSINLGKKTMIGANYFLKGELGTIENYTYLKLNEQNT
jgi:hypothetical protein